jgi:hypothetical protein
VSELKITVWPELQRGAVDYPIPLDASEVVQRIATALCGADGVIDAGISSKIGRMAFCRREDAPAWRAEVGVPEPTGGEE